MRQLFLVPWAAGQDARMAQPLVHTMGGSTRMSPAFNACALTQGVFGAGEAAGATAAPGTGALAGAVAAAA